MTREDTRGKSFWAEETERAKLLRQDHGLGLGRKLVRQEQRKERARPGRERDRSYWSLIR